MRLDRIIVIMSLVLVGVAGAQEPPALSPQDAEQRARVHFRLGEGHLQLKEYDEAIREFEIGYRYKPQPLFLYNIAQVAALAGQRDKAIDYFERYLAVSPKAPERAEVTQRIAQLKRERAAAAETLATPTATTTAPETATTTARTPSLATKDPLTATTPADAPPPKLPVQRHRGLRIGLGLASGAVLIGGIIALGVTLSTHNDSGYSDWGTLVVTRR